MAERVFGTLEIAKSGLRDSDIEEQLSYIIKISGGAAGPKVQLEPKQAVKCMTSAPAICRGYQRTSLTKQSKALQHNLSSDSNNASEKAHERKRCSLIRWRIYVRDEKERQTVILLRRWKMKCHLYQCWISFVQGKLRMRDKIIYFSVDRKVIASLTHWRSWMQIQQRISFLVSGVNYRFSVVAGIKTKRFFMCWNTARERSQMRTRAHLEIRQRQQMTLKSHCLSHWRIAKFIHRLDRKVAYRVFQGWIQYLCVIAQQREKYLTCLGLISLTRTRHIYRRWLYYINVCKLESMRRNLIRSQVSRKHYFSGWKITLFYRVRIKMFVVTASMLLQKHHFCAWHRLTLAVQLYNSAHRRQNENVLRKCMNRWQKKNSRAQKLRIATYSIVYYKLKRALQAFQLLVGTQMYFQTKLQRGLLLKNRRALAYVLNSGWKAYHQMQSIYKRQEIDLLMYKQEILLFRWRKTVMERRRVAQYYQMIQRMHSRHELNAVFKAWMIYHHLKQANINMTCTIRNHHRLNQLRRAVAVFRHHVKHKSHLQAKHHNLRRKHRHCIKCASIAAWRHAIAKIQRKKTLLVTVQAHPRILNSVTFHPKRHYWHRWREYVRRRLDIFIFMQKCCRKTMQNILKSWHRQHLMHLAIYRHQHRSEKRKLKYFVNIWKVIHRYRCSIVSLREYAQEVARRTLLHKVVQRWRIWWWDYEKSIREKYEMQCRRCDIQTLRTAQHNWVNHFQRRHREKMHSSRRLWMRLRSTIVKWAQYAYTQHTLTLQSKVFADKRGIYAKCSSVYRIWDAWKVYLRREQAKDRMRYRILLYTQKFYFRVWTDLYKAHQYINEWKANASKGALIHNFRGKRLRLFRDRKRKRYLRMSWRRWNLVIREFQRMKTHSCSVKRIVMMEIHATAKLLDKARALRILHWFRRWRVLAFKYQIAAYSYNNLKLCKKVLHCWRQHVVHRLQERLLRANSSRVKYSSLRDRIDRNRTRDLEGSLSRSEYLSMFERHNTFRSKFRQKSREEPKVKRYIPTKSQLRNEFISRQTKGDCVNYHDTNSTKDNKTFAGKKCQLSRAKNGVKLPPNSAKGRAEVRDIRKHSLHLAQNLSDSDRTSADYPYTECTLTGSELQDPQIRQDNESLEKQRRMIQRSDAKSRNTSIEHEEHCNSSSKYPTQLAEKQYQKKLIKDTFSLESVANMSMYANDIEPICDGEAIPEKRKSVASHSGMEKKHDAWLAATPTLAEILGFPIEEHIQQAKTKQSSESVHEKVSRKARQNSSTSTLFASSIPRRLYSKAQVLSYYTNKILDDLQRYGNASSRDEHTLLVYAVKPIAYEALRDLGLVHSNLFLSTLHLIVSTEVKAVGCSSMQILNKRFRTIVTRVLSQTIKQAILKWPSYAACVKATADTQVIDPIDWFLNQPLPDRSGMKDLMHANVAPWVFYPMPQHFSHNFCRFELCIKRYWPLIIRMFMWHPREEKGIAGKPGKMRNCIPKDHFILLLKSLHVFPQLFTKRELETHIRKACLVRAFQRSLRGAKDLEILSLPEFVETLIRCATTLEWYPNSNAEKNSGPAIGVMKFLMLLLTMEGSGSLLCQQKNDRNIVGKYIDSQKIELRRQKAEAFRELLRTNDHQDTEKVQRSEACNTYSPAVICSMRPMSCNSRTDIHSAALRRNVDSAILSQDFEAERQDGQGHLDEPGACDRVVSTNAESSNSNNPSQITWTQCRSMSTKEVWIDNRVRNCTETFSTRYMDDIQQPFFEEISDSIDEARKQLEISSQRYVAKR